DQSSIITILVGQDVDEEISKEVTDLVTKKFSDLDFDIRRGNQPLYSFLVGVE
ncbi:MAG: hypothetical protein GX813_00175, partial [Erysipelotrichia bacterium]|nr:hypothetical protein [Erysipelotrichia bacterium]